MAEPVTNTAVMSESTAISRIPGMEALLDALENVVSTVPRSRQGVASEPELAAAKLARKAARKAAAVSGALALPPGLFGMLTVLPDLVAIWRLQAQMVADIAGLHGKDLQLTRAHMLYCLFRHAASQAVRDIAVRTGERVVMLQLSGGALRSVLASIGLTVGPRVAGAAAGRWIPVIGAGAVAAYAYYDTLQVARTAIELLQTQTGDAVS